MPYACCTSVWAKVRRPKQTLFNEPMYAIVALLKRKRSLCANFFITKQQIDHRTEGKVTALHCSNSSQSNILYKCNLHSGPRDSFHLVLVVHFDKLLALSGNKQYNRGESHCFCASNTWVLIISSVNPYSGFRFY